MRSFWFLCFLCIWSQMGLAQTSQRVSLDIWGQQVQVLKLALPDFKVEVRDPNFTKGANEIQKVLGQDLANAGYFELIDLTRFAQRQDPYGGPIDFEYWGSIEADHLIVGTIRRKEDQMRVEVRLFDIAAQKHVLAKAYLGRPGLARRIGHVIADDIMYHLKNVRFATSQIVFTRDVPSKGTRAEKELHIMDYDGHSSQPIIQGGMSFAPSAVKVNSDTRLAYTYFERPGSINANYNIYFKASLPSRPKPLITDKNSRATSPSLSPDGRKIAFSMAKEGNVDLYVMNLDGSDFLRLTNHPAVDTNPSWSPGGNAILFSSDRTGSLQIYQMDADGLNKRRITTDNPYNDSAVWNPKQSLIAFVSRFENDFDLFVMDMKNGKKFRVTQKQGSNEDPYWSPDGNQLCFTSNRSGNWQIYVVNINGQNLRQVTFTGNNRNPIWVPGH